MKNLLHILILCSLLLSGASCCFSARQLADKNMDLAELIVEQQPDSALYLLEKIRAPKKLGRAQQMNYRLLLIKTKDKCNKDICADTTLIIEAKNYFLKKQQWNKAALAAFYSGRAYTESKNFPQALKAYWEAEDYAKRTTNEKQKGLIQNNIGNLFFGQCEYDKAQQRYKLAINHLFNAENYIHQITPIYALANCYVLENKNDSALHYYNQALAIAVTHNDSAYQSALSQNISVAYRQANDLNKAKAYLLKAIDLTIAENNKSALYLNLAHLFRQQQRPDSATFYVQQILSAPPHNESIDVSAYHLLSTIEAEQGNYKTALLHYQKAVSLQEGIDAKLKAQSLAGIQEKYNLALIKNENQQLNIKNNRIVIIAMIGTIIALLIIIGLYWKYARHKAYLAEVEEQISELKSIAYEWESKAVAKEQIIKDKEEAIYEILQKRLIMIKKIGLLSRSIPDAKTKEVAYLLEKINNLTDDTANEGNLWNVFYRVADELYSGSFSVIKQKHPELTATEFKICCLTLLDFPNKEIAVFLNLSPHTIATSKSLIRKKTKMDEGADFKKVFSITSKK